MYKKLAEHHYNRTHRSSHLKTHLIIKEVEMRSQKKYWTIKYQHTFEKINRIPQSKV